MFAYLNGQVTGRTERSIWLEVGGVGYDVQMPATSIARLEPSEKTVTVYTHLVWKEDDIQLYGFEDVLTKEVFLALVSVSGIGPRIALSILSFLEPEQAIACISSEDTARLQKIPGIGKKMAARLCVDLKDKAGKILSRKSVCASCEVPVYLPTLSVHRLQFDAVSALVNLGYSEANASEAVKKATEKLSDVEEGRMQRLEDVIKMALQELNRF